MIYTHNNHKLVLDKGKGKVYTNDKIVFIGFSYTAIITFIKQTDNHPDVVEKFYKQLNMRQKDDI